jgi:predicted class III extradiol MEMO1 family dioxygenase
LKPNNNNNTIITAANHERIMKMIKELDDIIRKTPEGEIRTDLEFTRDKLISSLYNENEDEDDKQKEKEDGEKKK